MIFSLGINASEFVRAFVNTKFLNKHIGEEGRKEWTNLLETLWDQI